MVSPQSEVGKLNKGRKGLGIHVPLTQQISLQLQSNQAAQTFDKTDMYIMSLLVPSNFRPYADMTYASFVSFRISFSVTSNSCSPGT